MKLLHAVLVTGLIFQAGQVWPATEQADTGSTQLLLDDMRTFTDVFNLVRLNYVDEVGDRELLDAALRGMVSTLDPYSSVLEPGQARDQNEQARGRFGGIGVGLEVREGRIFISRVGRGGPAHDAGVVVGDMIISVDGQAVKGRPLYRSMDGLKGEPGTKVEVGFEDRTVSMTREYIPVPSVYAELLDERFAYLRISHFHANSGGEFKTALHETVEQAPQGVDGIIVDLRGNGGGVIGSAIVIADGFLDEGLVVYTRGRDSKPQIEYFAEPGQWLPGIPVAVLIDGRTASASEILAGALQDHERAVLVGERSFGKGTVQTVLQLRNGSALKLTTSRYYTPEGRSINESGINPDVVAAANPERAEQAEDDLQIQKALEILGRKQH